MPANGNAPREDHEEGGDLDRDEVERLLMEVQSISPYFRGFKDNIDLLAESLTVDRFEGGETILQEGEEGTWMGILLTGELEVIVNGQQGWVNHEKGESEMERNDTCANSHACV